ncbi:MAG: hypothetical protein HS116_18335 [Planctomycetes bacterium]|nr:hypothetical protein [Planctomycetota bacterium]
MPPKLMRFLLWLLSWLPTETIYGPDSSAYLIRRTLFWCPWARVYLHEIRRSDADRHLHDHPWNFASLMLAGGYFEHTPAGMRMVKPGQLVRHRAEDMHRIELFYDGWHPEGAGPVIPAWTLVFCGRKRREWGFDVDGAWISQGAYFSIQRRFAGTNHGRGVFSWKCACDQQPYL